ncbi:AraC family transcriptional regulator [Halalkalibacter urbisdiaboli]|uniref:AraC family transcriptional regulator n=1 Tax=Halalkalibacter urbisdiaboli TaxID=1960589 RepID=UPI001FDAB052|nr:AraC family transcriptional regulator [Halalkalibacter urbisdiaboli]
MLKPLKYLELFRGLGWKSQYFRKSFILILLIAFIPGLISGIGIYWFGVGKVEEELRDLHQSQISQRAQNLNDQFMYLENSLSHWAFEPRFNASLTDLNFVKEFKETQDIVRTLLVLQGSHPLISNVELFVNNQQNPIIFKPNYNVIKNPEEYRFYQSILEKDTHVSWEHLSFTPQGVEYEDRRPILLTHNIPGISKNPFGSIIVTIDRYKLAQLLKTLTPYNEGATLLLNGEDVLVATESSNNAEFASVLRKQVLKQKNSNSEGAFSVTFKDETYSVSYGVMDRINSKWTYVSAAPMSSITSPMLFISRVILYISITGLIIAFVMSWFASKEIYSPVAKLVRLIDREGEKPSKNKDEFQIIEQQIQELSKESKSLQNRLSTHIPQLKVSFLNQLIEGYLYHYSEKDLRTRMINYGWSVQDHEFLVVDIQIIGLSQSNVSLINQDESLVSFAITNIVDESAQEWFEQFNSINFHDLSIGVLIIYAQEEDIEEKVQQFSKQIVDVLNRILEVQVTITISEVASQVKRIPHLFEEVKQGKRYRNYENKNQIINLQKLDDSSNMSQIFYPFDIEKEILQAIRMGQVDEVERLIGAFIEELTVKGVKEINIQPGMIQLFSSIQHEILHSGIHPYELFDGKNMFEEVAQIREPERMISWLTNEVITPYVQMLEGRVNVELKQLVEQVCALIQEQYMEDISLESCADVVGTNPYTLSKAFKKMIGVNFIDYVTTLRIDKAKELLLNTNMKINDISEQVGYRHSYFNRIFKKQVGIPPSQYRKVHAQDQSINQG